MTIVINGSTGIESVDGSAASPSVRGADSNSGIVYAADEVKISTGGTVNAAFGANAAELYYSGTKQFETTSTGCMLRDGVKLTFGDDTDFQLYHLNGGYAYLRDFSGKFYLQTNEFIVTDNGGSETLLTATANSSVNLYYNNVMTAATSSGGWDIVGWCRPGTDDYYDVGHPSYRWDDIRATNGSIVTSDKNEKNTIVDSDLGLSFVNKLKPVSYKFNGKTRTHYGLIAQDIETTLSDISKPTSGFAGFIKDVVPDELYVDKVGLPEGKKVGDLKRAAYTSYGLRYTEFISPLIKAVQELSAEVETLKTKVAALEAV